MFFFPQIPYPSISPCRINCSKGDRDISLKSLHLISTFKLPVSITCGFFCLFVSFFIIFFSVSLSHTDILYQMPFELDFGAQERHSKRQSKTASNIGQVRNRRSLLEWADLGEAVHPPVAWPGSWARWAEFRVSLSIDFISDNGPRALAENMTLARYFLLNYVPVNF